MKIRKITTITFIPVMLLLAVGSGTDKTEVLAKKYGLDESEVKVCQSVFGDKDLEVILDWVSKNSGFFGFGGTDCADLRKKVGDYGNKENMVYALKNDIKPNSDEFKKYLSEKEKAVEEKIKAEEAAAEEKRKTEEEFASNLSLAIAAGKNAKNVAATEDIYKAACKSDWKACADNSDYMNIHGANWTSKCRREAEKYAIGEVDWGGIFRPNFGTFHTGNSIHESGTITVIDRVAKFQNSFGAMLNTTTICKYDLINDKIMDVNFN